MTDIAEVWATLRALLESQRLAVLSTQDQIQPYSNLVVFAATPDLMAFPVSPGYLTPQPLFTPVTPLPWTGTWKLSPSADFGFTVKHQ